MRRSSSLDGDAPAAGRRTLCNAPDLQGISGRPTGDPVFDRDFAPAEALDVLAELRKSLRVLFPSPEALNEVFRLVQRYEVAGKRIHDANIVAVMATKEVSHLATYNREDFASFDEITLLSPPEEDREES